MSSPAKKRKLNNTAKNEKPPPKGLEYFFSKQKQNGGGSSAPLPGSQPDADGAQLTDEELARKLQAEWDKEAGTGNTEGTDEVEKPINDGNYEIPEPGNLTDQPGTPQQTAPVTINSGKKTLALQSAGMEEDKIMENLPLDEAPLAFEPFKYIHRLKEHWAKDGGDASYALLTRCFVLVSGTASRIKIVDTLVNCLRLLIEADPESLLPAVWLATNSISPAYISMELGLGGSAISKALKQVCGLDSRSLKTLYDKYGDAGDVAFEAKKKQSFTLRKPKPLSIKGVYQSLVKISTTQGQGSNEVKQRIVDRLLQDARGGEESRAFLLSKSGGAEYETQNIPALTKLKKEELADVWGKAEETVKACFAKRPNYNDLIPNLLEIGVCEELLIRCGLALHIPLRPMLGSITRDLSEMLTKLQGRDFSCEYKYDGQRAQVHCDETGKVSIFSRHLELMTDKYPDLVELVPKIRGDGVSSFIMEGEVVAVDSASGELKNFQALTNRARKDVEIGSITVQVCLFSFDLMYLNGQSLLNRSFRERRELLRSLFTEVPNRFTWVKSLDATSAESETVLDFFKHATESKCEGIMVKILDNLPDVAYLGGEDGEMKEEEPTPQTPRSKIKAKGKKLEDGNLKEPSKKKSRRKALLATYEPDKRLDSWLKVKKDYSSSFDTLDLIPIAGWHGQGRKAKWWSPILLAVRNEESGTLEAVCKCISGFTDVFYKANKSFYEDGSGTGEPKNTRTQMPSFIEYSGPMPDVWFEPQEVWEMAFADITLSPTYTAAIGLVSEERGLSLRFPRFLKKRDDKSIEEASTNEFLAGLWRKQEASASTAGRGKPAEDEGDAE
ncbi:DNA ligase I, ATP-dependent (dnl1) [Cordyceps javanica]|uniref:DNA ligase n=1 Tax=Cordyceps javanica TaxID=43265 RepID=A0A545V904_9HYPO|nr:DNA ligase I, ATP-dependent (dnl1) [Cordyceps javanica]TQW09427.1 DNA ligase I, ATP-dependent (dnl1) [Cordyceps javanica]